MNQDDILQSTRSVVQSLEALKNEHSTMIKTLCDKLESFKNDQNTKTVVEEEISILKNSDEMVHLGISEATVLMQLSNYLQSIEAEKQKIRSQVKRLCQENAWLRDELAAAQKKLQESEQNSAQIEVELSHLKFLKELKKFDEDLNTSRPSQAGSLFSYLNWEQLFSFFWSNHIQLVNAIQNDCLQFLKPELNWI